MNFEFSPEQQMIIDMFARFFDEHSNSSRIRAAQPHGFDQKLWNDLAELSTFSSRVPESRGGLELDLYTCMAISEEAGRTLASVPFAEALSTAKLLSEIDGEASAQLLNDLTSGQKVIVTSLYDSLEMPNQWISGGSIADYIIVKRENQIFAVPQASKPILPPNLASISAVEICLNVNAGILLDEGLSAISAWEAAREEWKLLTAALLTGAGREAVRLAVNYASERKQFGQLIGNFQAVSHPLADVSVAVDAAKYSACYAIDAIHKGAADAAASISMCLWLSCDASSRAVAQALHSFGGYGLTIDYDIHLYNLRVKAWGLAIGDPNFLLEEAGRRLYLCEETAVPSSEACTISLDLGEAAKDLASETRQFFDAHLTPELRRKAHYSHAGHDPEFHRKIAEAGLLFPDWPLELGGRAADSYAAYASKAVWDEYEWTTHPQGTANMVGHVMRHFGSEDLIKGPLAEVASGAATCALGFSEPSSGSDVFAAVTRAVRDGDDWVINGQKMFTSGAEQADYVLLLARTDATLAKHHGLTMFIVPLNSEGLEIAPVHTMQDELTSVTYYSNVRISDSYRLGDVGSGAKVLGSALEIEHGVSFIPYMKRMLASAEDVARQIYYDGKPLLERSNCYSRLARVGAHIRAGTILTLRSLWANVEGKPDRAFGSSTKLYTSESYRTDASDLLDLLAPLSLLKDGPAAIVNQSYRHSQVTTTYAGTSEVHRSVIAERQLGLPRTRL